MGNNTGNRGNCGGGSGSGSGSGSSSSSNSSSSSSVPAKSNRRKGKMTGHLATGHLATLGAEGGKSTKQSL